MSQAWLHQDLLSIGQLIAGAQMAHPDSLTHRASWGQAPPVSMIFWEALCSCSRNNQKSPYNGPLLWLLLFNGVMDWLDVASSDTDSLDMTILCSVQLLLPRIKGIPVCTSTWAKPWISELPVSLAGSIHHGRHFTLVMEVSAVCCVFPLMPDLTDLCRSGVLLACF